MLFRLLLRLAALLILVFAAVMILIRAQPYDDSELRAFLTPPDGCPAPCFMGIRPGVTTFDEGVDILKHHPWTDVVGPIQQFAPTGTTRVAWAWNSSSPELVEQGFSNNLWGKDGIVSAITIQTVIPLVEIWWSYGSPQWITNFGTNAYGTFFFSYPEDKLGVSVEGPGCTSMMNVLISDSILRFTNEISAEPEGLSSDYIVDVSMKKFRNVNPCYEYLRQLYAR